MVHRQQATPSPTEQDVRALLTPHPLDLNALLPGMCFPIEITGVSLDKVVPPRAKRSRGSSLGSDSFQFDPSPTSGASEGDDQSGSQRNSLTDGTPLGVADRTNKRARSDLIPNDTTKRQRTMDVNFGVETDIEAGIFGWRTKVGEQTESSIEFGESSGRNMAAPRVDTRKLTQVPTVPQSDDALPQTPAQRDRHARVDSIIYSLPADLPFNGFSLAKRLLKKWASETDADFASGSG